MTTSQGYAGKVPFVTAVASGIGRAAAVAFAREGASVVAADVKAALAQAIEAFGRLDVAFNNAGIEPRKPAPTADYDEEGVERCGARAQHRIPRHDRGTTVRMVIALRICGTRRLPLSAFAGARGSATPRRGRTPR
jgi:NAD(P)-dependent dehydrogenase (short-subunit alcohol dehydrogenase family)